MPLPSFPSYAVLLFDGFSEKPEPNIDRTEMESGPPKQMPKSSRAMETRHVKYRINSRAEFLSFKDWHRVDLKQGSAWFSWADPLDLVTKKARIVGGKIEPKALRHDLEKWDVDFDLETWG
ncbi:MAG: hypothetical protein LLG15_11165 [Betaproteobacteria bacterium]|nr:hypothetical protein [Betaproteobacteria bacterium]